MLDLAIDQHAKQINVCVCNEDGGTVLRRQASTRPEKIEAFFHRFTEMDPELMAILEPFEKKMWVATLARASTFPTTKIKML